MARKPIQFTMRFEVTLPTMSVGQTAEASVKQSAHEVKIAIAAGRVALTEKGFTVGKCVECRSKLQLHSTFGY